MWMECSLATLSEQRPSNRQRQLGLPRPDVTTITVLRIADGLKYGEDTVPRTEP